MSRSKVLFYILFLLTVSSSIANGQTLGADAKQYELKNDTLFSASGIKIFSGQKLQLGNATGYNGLYRSIISKWAAVVPRIWGKNPNFENDIENHVDNKKGKASLKKLIPGQFYTVGKIRLMGYKNKYHYYLVTLVSDAGEYKADISLALQLRELLLP